MTTESQTVPAGPELAEEARYASRRHGGSSWKGFWKIKPRGAAWAKLATLAARHHQQMAESFAAKIIGPPSDKWKRVAEWAARRAVRYGFLPL